MRISGSCGSQGLFRLGVSPLGSFLKGQVAYSGVNLQMGANIIYIMVYIITYLLKDYCILHGGENLKEHQIWGANLWQSQVISCCLSSPLLGEFTGI